MIIPNLYCINFWSFIIYSNPTQMWNCFIRPFLLHSAFFITLLLFSNTLLFLHVSNYLSLCLCILWCQLFIFQDIAFVHFARFCWLLQYRKCILILKLFMHPVALFNAIYTLLWFILVLILSVKHNIFCKLWVCLYLLFYSN